MKALAVFVVLVQCFLWPSYSWGQEETGLHPVSQGAVTVLTDGISDPAGGVVKAFSALSRRVDQVGKIRVIQLMGYGGLANIRDLLHLRGADFAIVNNDILSYHEIVNADSEAREKLRYVTKLFDQKIYLISQRDITSVSELDGKKVVTIDPRSPSTITAKNLFRLLKIDADVTPIPQEQFRKQQAVLDEADALLVLERDFARLPFDLSRLHGMHFLPIEHNASVAGLYRPALILPGEIPHLSENASVETLQLATILAVFDWNRAGSRYKDVNRFIKTLFESLPALKRELDQSIWIETNVHERVLDWERYQAAKDLLARIEAAPAASKEFNFFSGVQAPTPEAKAESAPDKALRISLVSRPPLSDPSLPQGGLIGELTSLVVRSVARSRDAQTQTSWSASLSQQLEDVLSKGGPDLAVPWERPDCNDPNNLGPHSALICDKALISEPIFQTVSVLFVRADSDVRFGSDGALKGKTLCVPGSEDISDINGTERQWVSSETVRLVRPANLIECISLVERREADGLLAEELEGRLAIDRLGLSSLLRIAERPIGIHGLHIIIAKHHPQAEALMGAINAAIAELRKSDQYASIVNRHLSRFWKTQHPLFGEATR